MAVLFNILLPVLAGICFFAAIIFFLRAFSARSRASHQAYEVGRVEIRQRGQVNLLRAFIALVAALFFLTIALGVPRIMAVIPAPTATPEPTDVPPTAEPTLTATPEASSTPLLPTPTSPVPTETVEPSPTVSPTPQPLTATVSSGVGVYLRDSASTTAAELEYLADGTVLFVLDGRQNADQLEWQQVQTESGRVGWVALDFITISEQ